MLYIPQYKMYIQKNVNSLDGGTLFCYSFISKNKSIQENIKTSEASILNVFFFWCFNIFLNRFVLWDEWIVKQGICLLNECIFPKILFHNWILCGIQLLNFWSCLCHNLRHLETEHLTKYISLQNQKPYKKHIFCV